MSETRERCEFPGCSAHVDTIPGSAFDAWWSYFVHRYDGKELSPTNHPYQSSADGNTGRTLRDASVPSIEGGAGGTPAEVGQRQRGGDLRQSPDKPAPKSAEDSRSAPERKSVEAPAPHGDVSGRHNGGGERGKAEPQPGDAPSVSRLPLLAFVPWYVIQIDRAVHGAVCE